MTKHAVIHTEDLRDALEAVKSYACERAEVLREANRDRAYTSSPSKPAIRQLLNDQLRAALEDEIVAATSTDSKSILKWELDRELVKKALLGLRLPELRAIAADRGVASRGDAERLATSIATAYRWDEEEIARLVLANEPEPTPERGHVSRIFPLTKRPDLRIVQERLSYVTDRYVRVGVARWFIFEATHVQNDPEEEIEVIQVTGKLRSYRAAVDDRNDTPQLSARPDQDDEVVLRLNARHPIVEVQGSSAHTARNALRALEFVCNLEGLRRAPYAKRPPGTPAASLAPESAMLLDLLYTRLSRAGIKDRNLTIARFRVASDADAHVPSEGVRPRLKAVRFEGDHLLDSSAACILLTSGRALVDWSAVARWSEDDEAEPARFPIRLALERDHGLVMTGFGTANFERSSYIHRALRDEMVDELVTGIASYSALDSLVGRMQEQAASGADATRASMLEDE